MTTEEIKNKIKASEYDFLRSDEHLGNNIILLGLGGSYSYGINVANSDIDIRGIAVNSKKNILTGKDFEQVIDKETDTTIYSFEKIVKLLVSNNPNIIELIGLKDEHYLFKHPVVDEIFNNKDAFLSKQCIYSFGGYATLQLRRLENKSARHITQSEQENHILKTIENASVDFKKAYFDMPNDAIKLYIDKSINDKYDSEIFMDVNLTHYPLRDYASIWSDMKAIISSYAKNGHRNTAAAEHGKIAKHMTHLVRLYLMCIDILKDGKIITYREKEHDFLMSIRNGKYLDENQQPTKQFYDIIDEYENQLNFWKRHTALPDKPNMKVIENIVENVNEKIVKGEFNGHYL